MDPRYPWGQSKTPSPDYFSHLPPLPSSPSTLHVMDPATGSNSNDISTTPEASVARNPSLRRASLSTPSEIPASISTLTHSVAVAMLEGRPLPPRSPAHRRVSASHPTAPATPPLPIIDRLRRHSTVGPTPAPLQEHQPSEETAGFSPGTLTNSHDHRLAHAQLRYQTVIETQSQAQSRPFSRPLSPAIAIPLDTLAANQLRVRRINSGAGIPGVGAFSPRGRSASLSTHPEGHDHEEGLSPALQNTEGPSVMPRTGLTGRGNSHITSPLRLDEVVLVTSRPPAHMRSSSAQCILQNLEQSNSNPAQHPRRVSFASVDSHITSNDPLPIRATPAFGIGVRRTSESLASNAGRFRSSSIISSLLAPQLDRLDDCRKPATVGGMVRPGVSTPANLGYEGEGYESEAENGAHPTSVRRPRTRSSGFGPGNVDTPKAIVPATTQSGELKTHSCNPSGAQSGVPDRLGHFPEAVKWHPVFPSASRDMEIRIKRNLRTLSDNNPTSTSASQDFHYTCPPLFPIDDVAPDEIIASTTIATIPIPSIKQTTSIGSCKVPIPQVITLRRFTPGDFPENIDGITSCGSKDSSPTPTIVRRNSWMSGPPSQGDGDAVYSRSQGGDQGERVQEQGGDGNNYAVDVGADDDKDSATTSPRNSIQTKGKSRAPDVSSEDEELIDITPLVNIRKQMTATPPTTTVTSNYINTHKPHLQKKKGQVHTSVISCVPPGYITLNSPNNGKAPQLPTHIPQFPNKPRDRPPQIFNLDALNPHERAAFERLLEDHPGIRELTQFPTQLPTLDQLREYETFDDFAADALGGNSGEEKVGFFKSVVQAMEIYFCCCITSSRKKGKPKRDSNGTTTPLFKDDSEYSSGEGRVGNGGRRRRMRNYGTMIERNLSGPAPAKLSTDSPIPDSNTNHKQNNPAELPWSSSLEGEIRPTENEDMPNRWVFHPAYEVDTEDPGDYAYISEGSAPDATSIWRGHVR